MSTGPVQVLVLGFDAPHFDGSVLAELQRLGEAGVVRLVDLLVVSRADDGTLEMVETGGDDLDGYGALAAALLAGDDPVRADTERDESLDTWSLADLVPETGVAVVALIEHLWAAPLGAALRSAGATLLEETWLASEDRALLASLEQAGS